jgi:hypothetical protein
MFGHSLALHRLEPTGVRRSVLTDLHPVDAAVRQRDDRDVKDAQGF